MCAIGNVAANLAQGESKGGHWPWGGLQSIIHHKQLLSCNCWKKVIAQTHDLDTPLLEEESVFDRFAWFRSCVFRASEVPRGQYIQNGALCFAFGFWFVFCFREFYHSLEDVACACEHLLNSYGTLRQTVFPFFAEI